MADQSREKWLNNIKHKPSDYWPLGDGWTYEKAFKYASVTRSWGTMMLDSVLLARHLPNLRTRIVDCLELPIDKILDLHSEYVGAASNLINYSNIC